MTLAQKLPERIQAGGRVYRVDLDFRNVLRLLRELRRTDLVAPAKRYHAMRCVMRRPPWSDRKCAELYAALCCLLFDGARDESGQPRITDFEQDAPLIRAAFLQAYGIDLTRDRLHWLAFRELLQSLPTGTRYADVLSIRARPVPEATKYNAAEREALIRAKAEYALELSESERRDGYIRGLRAMAENMIACAAGQRGGETDG